MKRKASIEIGRRAVEECYRLFPGWTDADISRRICGNRKLLYGWKDGSAPESMYLQRLHYLGADVIYILTGETKHD